MAKPEFDPSKPFEGSAKPAFNEEQPFSQPGSEEIPIAQSVGSGLMNGMSLGMLPQGAAIGQTALDTITGISSPSDIMARYRQLRDRGISERDELAKANPKSSMAANFVGSALPMAMGAGSLTSGLGETALEKAALAGGELGGIQGFADSKGDLTKGEFGQVLGDTITGAGSGMALGGIAHGALEKLMGAPEALKEFARNRAVSATGATKAQVKRMLNAPTAEGAAARIAGEDLDQAANARLQEQGKNLLDTYPGMDSPVVTAGANAETMLDRAGQLKQVAGKDVGDTLEKFDQLARMKPDLQQHQFNPSDIVEEIQKMQSSLMKNGQVLPIREAEYKQLQGIIDSINLSGNKPISFRDAAELIGHINNAAYADGVVKSPLMAQVRAIANHEIETSADAMAKAAGNPDLAKQYMKAKDFYRSAADAEKSLTGQAAKGITNRDLGITDYMTGGALASATHSTPLGIAGAAVHKLSKTYGNQFVASTANRTADVMRGVANAFAKTPESLKAIGGAMASSQDPLKQKLGRILTSAADRDETGRNALIFSIMQQPQYRDIMKSVINTNEDKQ